MTPARFWQRYVAWSLDAALLVPATLVVTIRPMGHALAAMRHATDVLADAASRLLDTAIASGQPPALLVPQWLQDPLLVDAAAGLQSALAQLLLPPLATYVLLALAWSLVFERGPIRATPGMRAMGLHVVDADGRGLHVPRVLARFVASGVSWLLGNVGHLMAAVPPRHLALHDRISATRVIQTGGATRLPMWAVAWILLQVLVVLAALGWLGTRWAGLVQGALVSAA